MQSTSPVGNGRAWDPASPSPAEVRAHLASVLASPAFRSSKRGARFLEFAVNEVLEGRADTVKERTLAIEVFDRSPSWDAGDDTIVRVGAREVRKRLAQYYAFPEAALEKIRIELPLGSYVPEFLRVESGKAPTAVVPSPTLPVEQLAPDSPLKQPRPRYWGRIAIGSVIVAGIAVGAWQIFSSASASPFDEFWAPFFRSSEPVLVAIAHPLVYVPSAHAYSLDSKNAPANAQERVAGAPLHVPPSALTGADFISQTDTYLAFGDAAAAASVQVLLAKHNREMHLRFASRVGFADLRDAPTVMIGGFSNRWTMEFTKRFRYHFGYDQHWAPSLVDVGNPPKFWTGKGSPDGDPLEDYFLICRLANSPSGTVVVVGAGISQLGTEAAGRFLSTPKLLDEILRNLSPEWRSHNLELVLHARVIGDSPAAPELVASYVW